MTTCGILGGTFDPIHNGHLNMAKYVINKTDIDEILFVPSKDAYYKENTSHPIFRYELVKAAIYQEENMAVTGIECFKDENESTYAIDVVKKIKEEFSNEIDEFKFVVGSDSFLTIKNWKNWQDLLNEIEFVVANRFKTKSYGAGMKLVLEDYKDRFKLIDIPALLISSTKIRDLIKNEEPIKYFIPNMVEMLIKKYGLYNPELENFNFENVI